jgi:hypothetical protein
LSDDLFFIIWDFIEYVKIVSFEQLVKHEDDGSDLKTIYVLLNQ